jgi:2-methylcitrate dehydratase PrpD
VIDACSQLRDEGLKPEEVSSIELRVHPLVLELTGKQSPKDGLEAKFSVYHGAACGILFGTATPAHYTNEIVAQTAGLRGKIVAVVDPDVQADECFCSVETTTGSLKKHVKHAVGSLACPMSSKQFEDKFHGQVGPVLGGDASLILFTSLGAIMEAGNITSIL